MLLLNCLIKVLLTEGSMNKYRKHHQGKLFAFTSILPGENLDYLELAAEVFVY